ncbi:MAG: molybdopterin biosynthesis protein MoeB [Robiginitomaculum sp.]|nr:MAG: molybdopterin biosynthesis protein MoeB [Robiginitomaculum sp.]
MTPDYVERYARHLVLKDIGGPGQNKLRDAKVLIIGAGGLGAPAALYLAAAGIGTLGLMDDDRVSLSNLQRQVLFTSDDVGRPKTQAAASRLRALNPDTDFALHQGRFDESQKGILTGYDLVLDGTDNFTARFAINAACHRLGKPLVSGAAIGFEGQLACFHSHKGQTPCYRCLVPTMPHEGDTCESIGVIGALTGIIGSMMALEAIKIITGAGDPLYGRLMIFDGLAGSGRTLGLPKDPACPVCSA